MIDAVCGFFVGIAVGFVATGIIGHLHFQALENGAMRDDPVAIEALLDYGETVRAGGNKYYVAVPDGAEIHVVSPFGYGSATTVLRVGE